MKLHKDKMKGWFLVVVAFFMFAAPCLGGESPTNSAWMLYAQGSSPSWEAQNSQVATYQYLYYPASQVYFDTTRELYFFLMNGKWIKSPTLPMDRLLQEMYRLLKPNSQIAVWTAFPCWSPKFLTKNGLFVTIGKEKGVYTFRKADGN